jgi:hypothetical protein
MGTIQVVESFGMSKKIKDYRRFRENPSKIVEILRLLKLFVEMHIGYQL